MQIFVPVPTIEGSAAALDTLRLGKQIIEAQQVMKAITDDTYGWQSHPAVNMWRGHPHGVLAYIDVCDAVWRRRRPHGRSHGAAVNARLIAAERGVVADPADLPAWWGRGDVHASHRSNLVRKLPEWYRDALGWTDDPAAPYVWPVPRKEMA